MPFRSKVFSRSEDYDYYIKKRSKKNHKMKGWFHNE